MPIVFKERDVVGSTPTRGQLERRLSQAIQSMYAETLGHRPSRVTCHLADKKLTVVLENSITPVEQLLVEEGQDSLVEQVRTDVISALNAQLIDIIEGVLNVKVLDLLIDSTVETGRTGMIAVLEEAPSVRPRSNGISSE